ncbi:MAG: hypothetical protein ACE15B_18785 [Bryobacteraceae bacterium]
MLPALFFLMAGGPVLKLPAPTAGELAPRTTARGLPLAGIHRKVTLGRYARKWQTENGRPVWRLAIQSPGAAAVRLHITGFGEGKGTLRVGQRTYTGGGDFWSDVILSDTAEVEFRPAGTRRELPFGIDRLSHLKVRPIP